MEIKEIQDQENKKKIEPQNLRRTLLIYPRFQLNLMVIILITFVICQLFILYQINHAFNYLNQSGIDLNLPQESLYFKFISVEKEIIFKNVILASVISSILMFFATAYLSHRVAGPIVRLRDYLKKISETNEVEPITFRKNDFFDWLPIEINRVFKNVKKINPKNYE